MHMHLTATDPRLTFRLADGIGVIPGGAPRDDLQAWRRAGKAASLALPTARPGAATVRQVRRRATRLRTSSTVPTTAMLSTISSEQAAAIPAMSPCAKAAWIADAWRPKPISSK